MTVVCCDEDILVRPDTMDDADDTSTIVSSSETLLVSPVLPDLGLVMTPGYEFERFADSVEAC